MNILGEGEIRAAEEEEEDPEDEEVEESSEDLEEIDLSEAEIRKRNRTAKKKHIERGLTMVRTETVRATGRLEERVRDIDMRLRQEEVLLEKLNQMSQNVLSELEV